MGLFDRFRKQRDEDELDPLKDLVPAKLRVGYLVDYDMQTWQVTAYNRYDFDGDIVDEWELTSGREKRYLELPEDDEEPWTLGRKVPIGAIDGNIRNHIIENDDPPDRVTHEGKQYFLDESSAGNMYPDGKPPAEELIKWEFIDKEEENFLTIEQWGETEFEASAGSYVEEYQFTNILPGS